MPQAAVFRPTGPAGFQSHRPDGRGFVQRRQSVARLASAARSARPAEQIVRSEGLRQRPDVKSWSAVLNAAVGGKAAARLAESDCSAGRAERAADASRATDWRR